jgi:hypothetical protein
MSKQSDSPISIVTGQIIPAFCRVKISGETVVLAGAGEAGIGFAQAYTSSGGIACVRMHEHGGTMKVKAAGTFAAGATLYPAAAGLMDDAVVGSPLCYALEAATAVDDIVEAAPAKNETDSSALSLVGMSYRARAATAMPTSGIWDKIPLSGLRSGGHNGSLLDIDWTHGEDLPSSILKDAASLITIWPGATGIGELRLFTTDDNQAAEIQWPHVPIKVSGAAVWALEARIKSSVIVDTKCGWFLGLMIYAAFPTGDLIVDGGTLQTEGSIGFQSKETDGNAVDMVYDTTGQAQQEISPGFAVTLADTYHTLGLYYDGTTIQGYADGVAHGVAISAANIAAATFPAGLIMVPTIALKAAAADDYTVTVDWIRVAQGIA